MAEHLLEPFYNDILIRLARLRRSHDLRLGAFRAAHETYWLGLSLCQNVTLQVCPLLKGEGRFCETLWITIIAIMPAWPPWLTKPRISYRPLLLRMCRKGLDLAPVPRVPEFTQLSQNGVWNVPEQTVVQTKTKCHGTDASQWHIVSRLIDTLKPIALFKITKTVPLLCPIRKFRVHNIWDATGLRRTAPPGQ
jgi:hypothetical protein